MISLKLSSNLRQSKIVNPKQYSLLQQIKIETINDLLNYYPIRYEDYSQNLKLKNIIPDRYFHVIASVQSLNARRSFRRGQNIVDVTIGDDTANFKIIFFNNKYITKLIRPNSKYVFFCHSTSSKYGISIINPRFIELSKHYLPNLIFPIYSESKSLSNKFFQTKISKIIHLAHQFKEFLPTSIIKKNEFPSLPEAIINIHCPKDTKSLSKAIKRISFNEIFILQLSNIFHNNKKENQKALSIKLDLDYLKQDISQLPFILTNYQKRSLWEILNDTKIKKPMNRLLEGDVGSGKTIVAALAMSHCVNSSFNSILIAPTEILAIQHFQKISSYLHHRQYQIGLYTQNNIQINTQKTTKNQFLKKLKKGVINITISTHTAFHLDFSIPKLNLVIVDEQHRFGVQQRNLLSSSSKYSPHTLTMSATPIPRSLALSIFGHLKISQIKALPSGRKPIITKIIHPQNREKTYDFLRQQLKQKRQAFVICPLVEQSEKLTVKSVTEEYDKLVKIFPKFKIGLMHGQLPDDEKNNTMTDFFTNKLQILVSTSVIEVGIDVPNANIIIIEGSERFGLSQLHQFRGRVGRGLHQSYCFLFTDLPSPKVMTRLKVLENTNDGFKISEADLKLRGPGDFSGLRQSGFPDLKMASLSDHELISDSLKLVKDIIKQSPDLSKFPNLLSIIKSDRFMIN